MIKKALVFASARISERLKRFLSSKGTFWVFQNFFEFFMKMAWEYSINWAVFEP